MYVYNNIMQHTSTKKYVSINKIIYVLRNEINLKNLELSFPFKKKVLRG